MLSLGLVHENLNLPLKTALPLVAAQGIEGLLLDATGALSPEQLSDTGRREIKHLFKSHQLRMIGLRCPLRHGFDELDGLENRLERLRAALQLSFDLGPRAIYIAPGPVPLSKSEPDETTRPTLQGIANIAPVSGESTLRSAMRDLLLAADRIGCQIILEAGSEPVALLADFIAEHQGGLLGISFDPAFFTLQGEDAIPELRAGGSFLRNVYARDARKNRLDRSGKETELGAGDTDWFTFAGTLEELNYRGWLTIKRQADDLSSQLPSAVRFLRRVGLARPRSDLKV